MGDFVSIEMLNFFVFIALKVALGEENSIIANVALQQGVSVEVTKINDSISGPPSSIINGVRDIGVITQVDGAIKIILATFYLIDHVTLHSVSGTAGLHGQVKFSFKNSSALSFNLSGSKIEEVYLKTKDLVKEISYFVPHQFTALEEIEVFVNLTKEYYSSETECPERKNVFSIFECGYAFSQFTKELQFLFLQPINSSSQSIYDPPFGCSFNKDGRVFWNDQQTFYNEPEYTFLCKVKEYKSVVQTYMESYTSSLIQLDLQSYSNCQLICGLQGHKLALYDDQLNSCKCLNGSLEDYSECFLPDFCMKLFIASPEINPFHSGNSNQTFLGNDIEIKFMGGSKNTSYIVSENGKKIRCQKPVLSLKLNVPGVHEFRVQYDGYGSFSVGHTITVIESSSFQVPLFQNFSRTEVVFPTFYILGSEVLNLTVNIVSDKSENLVHFPVTDSSNFVSFGADFLTPTIDIGNATSSSNKTLWVNLNNQVTESGKLIGFEAFVEKPGLITFVILEMFCQDGLLDYIAKKCVQSPLSLYPGIINVPNVGSSYFVESHEFVEAGKVLESLDVSLRIKFMMDSTALNYGYYMQAVSQDLYLNEGDLVGWMSHNYNGGVIGMQLSLENVFAISGNFAELDEILCYPSLSIIKGNQHVLTVVVEIPSYYEVSADISGSWYFKVHSLDTDRGISYVQLVDDVSNVKIATSDEVVYTNQLFRIEVKMDAGVQFASVCINWGLKPNKYNKKNQLICDVATSSLIIWYSYTESSIFNVQVEVSSTLTNKVVAVSNFSIAVWSKNISLPIVFCEENKNFLTSDEPISPVIVGDPLLIEFLMSGYGLVEISILCKGVSVSTSSNISLVLSGTSVIIFKTLNFSLVPQVVNVTILVKGGEYNVLSQLAYIEEMVNNLESVNVPANQSVGSIVTFDLSAVTGTNITFVLYPFGKNDTATVSGVAVKKLEYLYDVSGTVYPTVCYKNRVSNDCYDLTPIFLYVPESFCKVLIPTVLYPGPAYILYSYYGIGTFKVDLTISNSNFYKNVLMYHEIKVNSSIGLRGVASADIEIGVYDICISIIFYSFSTTCCNTSIVENKIANFTVGLMQIGKVQKSFVLGEVLRLSFNHSQTAMTKYLVDFGDGTSVTTLEKVYDYIYKGSSEVCYTLNVSAVNSVSFANWKKKICLMPFLIPIKNLKMNNTFGIASSNILLRVSFLSGNWFTCVFDFGDKTNASVSYNENSTKIIEVLHQFQVGAYNVKVDCHNEMFSANVSAQVLSQNVTTIPYVVIYGTCDNKTFIEGIKVEEGLFYPICPIFIQISDQQGINVTVKSELFIDGLSQGVKNATNGFVFHYNVVEGQGKVNIISSNLVSQNTKTITFLFASQVRNFTFILLNKEPDTFTPTSFFVEILNSAYKPSFEICYESSKTVLDGCTQILAPKKGSQFRLSYQYLKIGIYTVQATFKNAFSSISNNITFPVKSYKCEKPVIKVVSVLGSNIEEAKQNANFFKCREILFKINVMTDCERPNTTLVNKIIIFLVSSSSSGADSKSKEIVVPEKEIGLVFKIHPKELDYGYYSVVFTSAMQDKYSKVDVDEAVSKVTGYFSVKPCELKAVITEGYAQAYRKGDVISIDGSNSYDPDDLNAAITPTWFCSNTGAMDNFTAFENATIFFGIDPSKTSNTSKDVSLQGCYGNGKEVIRLADKGQYGSKLYINTESMPIGCFDVMLRIQKQNDFSKTRQALQPFEVCLQKSNTLQIQVSCYQNCEATIQHNTKLCIHSNLSEAQKNLAVNYNWQIFIWNPETRYTDVTTEFNNSTTTSLKSQHLCINAYSLKQGRKYKFFVNAQAVGFDTSIGAYISTVNNAPDTTEAWCSIVPKIGIATVTSFNITCNNVIEVDVPLTYKIYFKCRLNQKWKLLTLLSSNSYITNLKLPQASVDQNCSCMLRVVAMDLYESVSDPIQGFGLEVKVLPVGEMERKSYQLYNSECRKVPVDGGFTNWTLASPCSKSCGGGFANYTRKCNNPIPENGGLPCQGKFEKVDICNAEPCWRNNSINGQNKTLLTSPLIDVSSELSTTTLSNNTSSEFILYELTICDDVTKDSAFENQQMITNYIVVIYEMLQYLRDENKKKCELQLFQSLKLIVIDSSSATAIVLENIFYYADSVTGLKVINNSLGFYESLKPEQMVELASKLLELTNLITISERGVNASSIVFEAMNLEKYITFLIARRMTEGEIPIYFKTSSCQILCQCVDISSSKSIGSFSLPDLSNGEKVKGCTGVVNIEGANRLAANDQNIAKKTVGPVKGFSMNGRSAKNLTTPVTLFIENEAVPPPLQYFLAYCALIKNIHKVDVIINSSSIVLSAKPVENFNGTLFLFMNKGTFPSFSNPDQNCSLPNPYPSNWNDLSSEKKNYWITEKMWTCFFTGKQLNNTAIGSKFLIWCVGVIFYNNGTNITDELLSSSSPVSADNCSKPVNYTFLAYTRSCLYWNVEKLDWDDEGCEIVEYDTNTSSTKCACNHLTDFGGGGPFAKIEPLNLSALLKHINLADNPTVFAVVMALFGVYLILLIWCWKNDKYDIEKTITFPLQDNQPDDSYFYKVSVQTGFRPGSSTSADVIIVISGTGGETVPRKLYNPLRKCFQRGQTDTFLLSVPYSLGNLEEVTIWHNNAGFSPGWFCMQIKVRDLQTEDDYQFVCNRWLDVAEDDGEIMRTLYLAAVSDLTEFSFLFTVTLRKNLYDGHIWLSIFTKPIESTFTRCQRLATCFSLLLTTMLANAMFYRGDNGPPSDTITVGPVKLSVDQLKVAFTSSMIVIPPNLVIVTLFKKAGPKLKTLVEAYKFKSQEKEKKSVEEEYTSCLKFLRSILFAGSEDDKEQRLQKKRNPLPHWLIYIAYVIAFITTMISAFYVVMYGFSFGKLKSDKWIVSIMLSFVQSICFIQPIKVIVLSIIFSALIKSPPKKDDSDKGDLNVAVVKQNPNSSTKNQTDRLWFKLPNEKALEDSRKSRFKEKRIKIIISEILKHLSFVVLCFSVTFAATESGSFPLYDSVTTLSVKNGITKSIYPVHKNVYTVSKSKKINIPTADNIQTELDWWNWMQYSVVEFLFPLSWYNSNKNYPMGFTADSAPSKVLSLARIRQLRVKPMSCVKLPVFFYLISECNAAYSWSTEETRDFSSGWLAPLNQTERFRRRRGKRKAMWKGLEDPWTYQGVGILKNPFPFTGRFATYNGASYSVSIGPNRQTALKVLKAIKGSFWVDRYTRALFTEINIYNANTNLMVIVTFLHEILPTGGWNYYSNVQSLKLYRYMSGLGNLILLFDLIFIAVTTTGLYKIIRTMYRNGSINYLMNFWNILNVIVTSCSAIAIVLAIARMLVVKFTMKQYEDDPEIFVSFQYVGTLEYLIVGCLGFTIFFTNLEFLRILRFNYRISVLLKAMGIISGPLASFGIIFLVIFMAYVSFAHCIYVDKLEEFETVMSSFMALTKMFLGKFDVYAYFQNAPFFGPLMFSTYMLLIQMVMINLFVGLICDGFIEIGNLVPEDREPNVAGYISSRIKVLMDGNGSIDVTYCDQVDKFQAETKLLEDQCDTCVYLMRNIEGETSRHVKLLEKEEERNKEILKALLLVADDIIYEDDLCESIHFIHSYLKKVSDDDFKKFILKATEEHKDSLLVARAFTPQMRESFSNTSRMSVSRTSLENCFPYSSAISIRGLFNEEFSDDDEEEKDDEDDDRNGCDLDDVNYNDEDNDDDHDDDNVINDDDHDDDDNDDDSDEKDEMIKSLK